MQHKSVIKQMRNAICSSDATEIEKLVRNKIKTKSLIINVWRCDVTEIFDWVISDIVMWCKNFSPPFTAANVTDMSFLLRTQRHLLLNVPSSPVRASWAGGEGYACITSRGILGSCQPFRSCYPFFKAPPPGARYPVLNVWDSWVLGNYDTCSYHTDDGREAHGVCCTNPITPSVPPQSDGTEQNKVDLPAGISNWPPPLPTHPPNHTPATHPTYFGQQPALTTPKPVMDVPSTSTTWATRPPFWATTPPSFAVPGQTTTKRPSYFTTTTTEAPDNFDIEFNSGSCGAKNGFQVCEKLSPIAPQSS